MEINRVPILGDAHPFGMLIFTALVVFLSGILFQFLSVFSASLLFDVPFKELLNIESIQPGNGLNALKFSQIFGAIGTFIFSSLLLSFIYTGSWIDFFPFNKNLQSIPVIVTVLIMIAALPLVNLLTALNYSVEIPVERLELFFRDMEEAGEAMMMKMIRAETAWDLVVNLLMIAIIPAIGEELLFRGLIQRHLTDWFRNPHLAILLASTIFSLAHFQVYSFLPRMFLGVLLGYFYYYGRSMWYPMIAHLINNALGVVFYFFLMRDQASEAIEQMGTSELMPGLAILSLVAVGGLMIVWKILVTSNQSFLPGQPGKD